MASEGPDFGINPAASSTGRVRLSAERRRQLRRAAAGLLALLPLATGAAIWWFGVREPDRSNPIQYDPIENDPAVKPLLAEADREANRRVEEMQAQQGRPGKPRRGDIHFRWGVKKEFLKEKYGIDWRTPAEMNPNIAFD